MPETDLRFPKTVKPHDGNGGTATWFATARVSTKDGNGSIAGQPSQAPSTATMKSGQTSMWLACQDFGFAVPDDATVTGIKFSVRAKVGAGKASIIQTAAKIPGKGFSALDGDAKDLTGDWQQFDFTVPAEVLDPGQDLDPAIGRSVVADPNFGFALAVKSAAAGTKALVDSAEGSVVYTQESTGAGDPEPTIEDRVSALEEHLAGLDERVSSVEGNLHALEARVAALESASEQPSRYGE